VRTKIFEIVNLLVSGRWVLVVESVKMLQPAVSLSTTGPVCGDRAVDTLAQLPRILLQVELLSVRS